ncbi:hypothetical protein [Methanocella arvoryzae]|uniref:hypothetical protein n=1 Tax=Methanocella arvoryzae TaxID=1175445 RepID=UPI0013050CBC|nr:hypothetical protein [Methanocella arvoryzae]
MEEHFEEGKKRLMDAEKKYKDTMKKVKPYITKRKIVQPSTEGEWCETSTCLFY